ncbi:MAG: DUF3108 domain-containing protein [Proteobacteria bacterium]|nr:DUF3108 domain-containing protein [Pseudomonadota bacterium]
MRSSILFLTSLSFACAAAAVPAQRVEVAYELSRNGTAIAELVERLEHDGKTYRLSAQMKGKGLAALRGDASRTSRGTISPEGLLPTEFEDKRSGRDTARARADWQAKTLTLHAKEGASEAKPLPPDLQDRLSFTYSFAFRPQGSAPVPLSITDGKGVSTSVYEVAGRETLKTPAGEFESLRMARKKNSPEDRSSEIWLATKLGLVPVRVLVVEKDGTRIDQVATRVVAQ